MKVYVSVFGDDRGKDVAIAGLKSKAKYVRSELGKRMKLRLTPEVRFIEDESMERGSRVRLQLISFTTDRLTILLRLCNLPLVRKMYLNDADRDFKLSVCWSHVCRKPIQNI